MNRAPAYTANASLALNNVDRSFVLCQQTAKLIMCRALNLVVHAGVWEADH